MTTREAFDLHSQIMNLPWSAPSDCMTPTERMGYEAGHRDARHAAAELALSASQGREELMEALKAIVALETRPFEYPADWSEQIAACPDCQRFKDHPLFNGICDTHRKPMYGRERHDEQELRSIGWRAKDIARAAIAKEQGAKK